MIRLALLLPLLIALASSSSPAHASRPHLLTSRSPRNGPQNTYAEYKAHRLKIKNAKYFSEEEGSTALHHYDSRFFKEEVPYGQHRYVLRSLIRSYLTFFEEQKLETWIAHGSLLGWWWNGHLMPWDYDLDVQVTNGTMQWMADYLNTTEHAWTYTIPSANSTTTLESVNTTYLLDINPNHADISFDTQNVIDGRWVDTSNGLYIDITALREREPLRRPASWSCKNKHHYSSHDLWPMRVTEFEGVRARVPHKFEDILIREYGAKGLRLDFWEE
jgi:hypothetical protein